jgi:hypothetical protein
MIRTGVGRTTRHGWHRYSSVKEPFDVAGFGVYGGIVVRVKRFGYLLAGLLIAGVSFPVGRGSAQTAPSGYRSEVIADGPLAYWRFEESTGVTLADEVDNSHPGTAVNGATIGSPGAFGSSKAVGFDGVDDRVDTGLLQSSVTTRSLEAWIKTTGPVDYEYATIVTTRNSGSGARSLTLGMGNGRTLSSAGSLFIAYDADNAFLGIESQASFNDNRWHHVVGSWSAPAGALLDLSQFKLFVDGVAVPTNLRSFCYVNCRTAPISGVGGTSIGSSARYWRGSIDEVAVYDKVLIPARVLAHYRAAVPPDPYEEAVDADGPLSHWRLGEATGTVPVVDRIAGFNGTGLATTPGVIGAVGGSDTATGFGGGAGQIQTTRAVAGVSSYTYETWARVDPGSGGGLMDARGPLNANGRGLLMELDVVAGKTAVRFGMGTDNLAIMTQTLQTIDDGKWHHIVGTWAGTSGSPVTPSQFKIYIDGVLAPSVPVSVCFLLNCSVTAPISGGGQLLLGRVASISSSLRGGLDEVAVYDKALSPERVLAHFNAAAPTAPSAQITSLKSEPVLLGDSVVITIATSVPNVKVSTAVIGGAVTSLGLKGVCGSVTSATPATNSCTTGSDSKAVWLYRPTEAGRESVRVWVDRNNDGFFQVGEPSDIVYVEVLKRVQYGPIGDSFVTGSLTKGTPIPGTCDQYQEAYPVLLSAKWYRGKTFAGTVSPSPTAIDVNTRPFTIGASSTFLFLACSGATVTEPSTSKGLSADKQRINERPTVDLITAQIGRNGTVLPQPSQAFSQFFKDCLAVPIVAGSVRCVWNPGGYESQKKREIDKTIVAVKTELEALRNAFPEASIMAIGYPQVFPASTPNACNPLQGYYGSLGAIRTLTRYFNEQLELTAQAVGVHYVSPDEFDNGHTICTPGEDWVTSRKVTEKGSPHPNIAGHRAYARIIREFVEQKRTAGVALLPNGLPRNPPFVIAQRAVAAPAAAALAVTTDDERVDREDLEVSFPGIDPTCAYDSFPTGVPITFKSTGFVADSVAQAVVTSGATERVVSKGLADANGNVTLTGVVAVGVTGLSVLSVSGTTPQGPQESFAIVPLANGLPLCLRQDAAAVSTGNSVAVAILQNDAVGAAPIRQGEIRVTSQPQFGSVTFSSTGIATYQSKTGSIGVDMFGYEACTTNGCADAVVTINIGGCTITGTNGNDTLTGTVGNDVICGLDGDDMIYGLDGDDVLIGGDQNDLLYGGGGNDVLTGGNGTDYFSGGIGTNRYPDAEPTEVTIGVIDPAGSTDTTAPEVSITSPNDATYSLGQSAVAAFTCTDNALATCVGTTNTNSPIDTSSLGIHTFTVTGTDSSGNQTYADVSYRVVPSEATATEPIIPIAECVTVDPDGSLVALFGYDNQTGASKTVRAGTDNTFTGVTATYPPSFIEFQNGQTTAASPPIAVAVPVGATATWNLQGRSATANRSTKRCSTTSAPGTGLWSTSPTNPGISITGSQHQIQFAHSESSITLTGAQNTLSGGVEYVTTFTSTGTANNFNPAPQRVTGGTTIDRPTINAYRPGGIEALAAGTNYMPIPSTSCVAGTWRPTAAELTNGVTIYVPCNVNLVTAGLTRKITIAAEGSITISGAGSQLTSVVAGGPVLLAGGTNSAISLTGAGSTYNGSLIAGGPATITGSQTTLNCGVIAKTIVVTGARLIAKPC